MRIRSYGRSFGSKPRKFSPKKGGGFAPKNRSRENIDPAKFINKAVEIEETDSFMPEHKFQDFKVDQRLIQAVMAKGYKMPTPIQDKAIPHILNGSDLVGIDNTGTGKTAVFLVPVINKVLFSQREQILIVTPTRELAIQIDQEFKFLTKGLRMFSVCCVGGAGIGGQIDDLRYDYNVVVGTPGRLKDLIQRRNIRLSEFNTIVLDEADRMLDMGFINDTRFIMNGLPRERQVLFFSATISYEIDKIIKEFLRNPVQVSVKTRDTAENINQDVIKLKCGENKLDILHSLLRREEFNKVLIFGRTKYGVEKLAKILLRNGFKADAIHGNKSHPQRQKALGLFKENRIQILVATDVAARGLDIADVSHVINYDVPATYDDYVHRIGRTGRWNKKGTALTFID